MRGLEYPASRGRGTIARRFAALFCYTAVARSRVDQKWFAALVAHVAVADAVVCFYALGGDAAIARLRTDIDAARVARSAEPACRLGAHTALARGMDLRRDEQGCVRQREQRRVQQEPATGPHRGEHPPTLSEFTPAPHPAGI